MSRSIRPSDIAAESLHARATLFVASHSLARALSIGGFELVVAVAAAIRFADLNNLTLRIDELYTLLYSRQSWVDIAGLNGYYDSHPPLYTVLAEIGRAGTGELIIDDAVLTYLGPRQKPPES